MDESEEGGLPGPSPEELGLPEPEFMKGTMLWMERGYRYASEPPLDLLGREALSSSNPWIVLAATLEHAKQGDHRPVGALLSQIPMGISTGVVDSAIELFGDAAPLDQLPQLTRFMRPDVPSYIRVRACGAACSSGMLEFIPAVLDVWQDLQTERGLIEVFLSDLLDEKVGGPICEGPRWDPYDDSPDADERATKAYIEFVNYRSLELATQADASRTSFFQGQPRSLARLIEMMRSLLSPSNDSADIGAQMISWRHCFEATTGVDCTGFYRKQSVQALTASAIIEDLVAKTDLNKFQSGVRYFFGHAVP